MTSNGPIKDDSFRQPYRNFHMNISNAGLDDDSDDHVDLLNTLRPTKISSRRSSARSSVRSSFKRSRVTDDASNHHQEENSLVTRNENLSKKELKIRKKNERKLWEAIIGKYRSSTGKIKGDLSLTI